MNHFLAWKIISCKSRTFYIIWINLLITSHKLINFSWIINNLIVHNLLIDYLNLMNKSIQKQLLTGVLLVVLTNQKQPWQMFFKIGVLKNSLFNKFAGLQLSCEYCECLKEGQCRFENLPLYLCSYKNHTLKTSHS